MPRSEYDALLSKLPHKRIGWHVAFEMLQGRIESNHETKGSPLQGAVPVGDAGAMRARQM